MNFLDFSNKGLLRDEIGRYMKELGKLNNRVMVVNADLMKTSRNQSFAESFPERTFNVGIAEQNMVGFAAGLAHEGMLPYVFSMAPFISMRACEQCRTDVAYESLNVRLMATYAGLSGGISGATHWGMEDCAIMCAMPNMTVLEPSDVNQARKMMDATLDFSGPVYMRISVEPVARIYGREYKYKIGKASVVKDGDDGTFICAGVVVQYALEAAIEIKNKTGMEIRVVDMHTIKPIDREAVISAAKTGCVAAAQDHNVIGGLGNAVAEIIAEEGLSPRFINLGIPDIFETMAHPKYLYHKFGYDAEGLENCMLKLLNKKSRML